MAYEYNLTNLRIARRTFDEDRPVLKDHNAQPKSRFEAFLTEVDELNGPDKEGFFGQEAIQEHPERLTDYRQQEVADIMLIALSLPELFNFELNEGKILFDAYNFAQLLDIQIVKDDQSLEPVKAFTEKQEWTYSTLKYLLNAEVKQISDKTLEDQSETQRSFERILTFCYVIFYLMGLSPVKACFEKISRNMLKYLAIDYQEGEEVYEVRAQKSKDAFDGPVDSITGIRPQWGTRIFYGPQEILPEIDWHDKKLTALLPPTPFSIALLSIDSPTPLVA